MTTTPDTITILAFYGAALSTLLALLEIIKFVLELTKNNRRVKVTSQFAIVGISAVATLKMLSINVVNIGNRPITITSAGLLMSDKQLFTQLPTEIGGFTFPKLLNDGESASIMLSYNVAMQKIKGLKVSYKSAYVCDAEGKYYRAKLPKDFGN